MLHCAPAPSTLSPPHYKKRTDCVFCNESFLLDYPFAFEVIVIILGSLCTTIIVITRQKQIIT